MTALFLSFVGCLTAQPPPSTGCAGCHGSGSELAPPQGLGGVTDPFSVGVGAHPTHSRGTAASPATACTDCHEFPASTDAPGHIDDSPGAEVRWNPEGLSGRDARPYDAEAHTCTVYCHGPSAIGWTDFGLGCDGCHGAPPETASHRNVTADSCTGSGCHPDTTPATHVDGALQIAESPTPEGCGGACHGTAQSPAPPPDTFGSSDPTTRGVGAHAAHLDSTLQPTACSDCHVVYADTTAEGHLADSDADLQFGGVAVARGYVPTFDPATQTCANTECHAGPGAARPSPTWTDTTPNGCGDCHGNPPATESHRAVAVGGSCEGIGCHAARVPGTHVDGIVDFDDAPNEPTCGGTCHGTPDSPSPPPDTFGNTDSSSPGVGAHAVHLSGGGGVPVPCETCHVVPAAVSDPGHVTDGPGDIVFSGISTNDGHVPTYDPLTQTCADSYCHVGPGAASPIVTWTGGPLGCGDCHGDPPPSPHPATPQPCGNCHPHDGFDSALHIDGFYE